LRKLIDFSALNITPYHFRTSSGQEVDFVLEGAGNSVVGIEVKASANINRSDFTGLQTPAESAAHRFQRGLLLYLGDKVLPFGEKLYALPISALWTEFRG